MSSPKMEMFICGNGLLYYPASMCLFGFFYFYRIVSYICPHNHICLSTFRPAYLYSLVIEITSFHLTLYLVFLMPFFHKLILLPHFSLEHIFPYTDFLFNIDNINMGVLQFYNHSK